MTKFLPIAIILALLLSSCATRYYVRQPGGIYQRVDVDCEQVHPRFKQSCEEENSQE